jgi:hypothetical protein
MADIPSRKPRFKVGDYVCLVGPTGSGSAQKRGRVVEVTETATDPILRYKVAFPDGQSRTFFGFELELEIADAS